MIIGIVGGFLYLCSSRLLIRLNVDDPMDVIPVHAVRRNVHINIQIHHIHLKVSGIWAAVSVGLFASLNSILTVHPQFDVGPDHSYEYGVFMVKKKMKRVKEEEERKEIESSKSDLSDRQSSTPGWWMAALWCRDCWHLCCAHVESHSLVHHIHTLTTRWIGDE